MPIERGQIVYQTLEHIGACKIFGTISFFDRACSAFTCGKKDLQILPIDLRALNGSLDMFRRGTKAEIAIHPTEDCYNNIGRFWFWKREDFCKIRF